MVEHIIRNDGVAGSIPATSSIRKGGLMAAFLNRKKRDRTREGSTVGEAVRWTGEQVLV